MSWKRAQRWCSPPWPSLSWCFPSCTGDDAHKRDLDPGPSCIGIYTAVGPVAGTSPLVRHLHPHPPPLSRTQKPAHPTPTTMASPTMPTCYRHPPRPRRRAYLFIPTAVAHPVHPYRYGTTAPTSNFSRTRTRPPRKFKSAQTVTTLRFGNNRLVHQRTCCHTPSAAHHDAHWRLFPIASRLSLSGTCLFESRWEWLQQADARNLY